MSYTVWLIVVVLYKVCRIILERQTIYVDDAECTAYECKKRSKNWLSVTIYVLLLIDLVVGAALVSCMVLTKRLFDEDTAVYMTMHKSTTILFIAQQLLYQLIFLSQLFEWSMYIVLIEFQQ